MQGTPLNAKVSHIRSQTAGDKKKQADYFIRLGQEMLPTRPQEALGNLSQAIEISLRHQSPQLIIKSYCALGNAYVGLKRFVEALTQYHNALAVSKTFGLKQRNILYLLYQTYKSNEEYENALKYHEYWIKQQNIKPVQEASPALKDEVRSFLQHILHDIKEPVRIINSYTQLLKKSIREVEDKACFDYLQYTEDSISRIKALIQSFGDYVAIDTGKLQLSPVALSEVVVLTKNSLYSIIKNTKAEIINEPLPVIEADYRLVTNLFRHLISNAILYKKADVTPKITIKAIKTPQNYHISIQDNGLGISEQEKKKLFDIAHGPKRHKNNVEAAGMGLIICKRIIDKHKGSIWIESELGKGSTFHFTLPIIKK